MKQLGLKAFIIATSMFFSAAGNAQNPIDAQTQFEQSLNQSLVQTKTADKDKPVVIAPTSPKPIFPPMFGVSDVPPLNFSEKEWSVFASRLSKQNPITRSKVFDPSDESTWFDPFRIMLPSVEDTERVKLDMTIGEVVSILGRPQIAVGSGCIIYAFYLNNGQVFLTWWDSNIASDRIYRLWRMDVRDENPFRIYL